MVTLPKRVLHVNFNQDGPDCDISIILNESLLDATQRHNK